MQGEALLDIRKRPSPIEKGVSLISKYNYLYPPLPPSPILLAVFTPLSIRRGVGGEAVDGLVVSLLLAGDRLVVGFVLCLFLFSLDYNKRGGESVI